MISGFAEIDWLVSRFILRFECCTTDRSSQSMAGILEIQTKPFSSDWSQHCILHSLDLTLTGVIADYLFVQKKKCLEVVCEILLFLQIEDGDQLKNPTFFSLTRCLLSYCDLIRKYQDDSPSGSLHSSKLFYSLCISILFLRLIFEISSRKSNSLLISLQSIPKVVRKGVIKSLSIVGFNCSDYQSIISDSEASKVFEEKFFVIFPDMTSHSSLLHQTQVMDFFRSSYGTSCPRLVIDLFDDVDDELSVLDGILSSQVDQKFKKVIKRSISQDSKTNVPFLRPVNDRTIPALQVNALTRRSESNILLSKSRTSSMNGHRLGMERRLQKQQITVATSAHISISADDKGTALDTPKKRMSDTNNESRNTRQRRSIIEDTPIRK
jgi:hypothetical protein